MNEKKPPQKPTNLRVYDCSLAINRQHLTILEISPYYEKHNQEYLEALEKKGIILSKEELAEKLITDDLIRELVKQLDGKDDIISVGKNINWEAWSYYVYEPVFRSNGKAYKLVWCFDDNHPHILGILDCYRRKKYDKEIKATGT